MRSSEGIADIVFLFSNEILSNMLGVLEVFIFVIGSVFFVCFCFDLFLWDNAGGGTMVTSLAECQQHLSSVFLPVIY